MSNFLGAVHDVGAGVPANTGEAGANHRVEFFAGMPAPTGIGAGAQPWVLRHTQLTKHERILQRHILQALVPPAHPAMPSPHLGLEQQQVVVGLARA